MELAFATQALRRICEDPDAARSRLGAEMALELEDRLAELRAAESLAELPVGAPSTLRRDLPFVHLPLGTKGHMTAEINHKRVDWSDDGQLDPGTVWRVKVTAVEPGAKHD